MLFKKIFFLAFFIATLLPSIALSQLVQKQHPLSPKNTCTHIKDVYALALEKHIIFPNIKLNSLLNKSGTAYNDVAFAEALTLIDQSKVFDSWINRLDQYRIYLSKQDVVEMKKLYDEFASSIITNQCGNTFFKLYDFYIVAVFNRVNFLMQYAHQDFKIEKNTPHIIQFDKESRPKNETEMEQHLKIYAQSFIAGLFASNKNIKKSIAQFRYLHNRSFREKMDWTPAWKQKKQRECHNKTAYYGITICKPSQWVADYLHSFLTAYDPHSGYLDERASKDITKQTNNTPLVGVGVLLEDDFAGYFTIQEIMQDGPAFKSQQLKVGDTITGVGQNKDKVVDIFGLTLSRAISIVKGAQGTKGYYKILRKQEGQSKEIIVELTRDLVKNAKKQIETTFLKWVEVSRGSTKYRVAVIHISSFYNGIAKEVKELVQQANEGGAQSMVLDVAGSPGGLVQDAAKIAGLFLHQANIVGIATKSNQVVSADQNTDILYAGPLVVLTNQRTASAAEILAGALKDYNRAVIVGGDHTFGKGSVQRLIPFLIGTTRHIIKITRAIYLTPSSGSPQDKGIVSDIKLPNFIISKDSFNLPEDIAILSYDEFLSPRALTDPDNKIDFINAEWIETLNNQSQKRVDSSSKFQNVRVAIEEYKEFLKKSTPIQTIGEYLEQKKIDEQKVAEQKVAEQPASSKNDNYEDRAQVEEAINIAADLAQIIRIEKDLNRSQAYYPSEFSNLKRVDTN